MTARIRRLPNVKDQTGYSRSTVYARIAEGLFPKPILLGPRMVGWLETEVSAVIAARVRGATEDEIRTLVAQLEADRKNAA